MSFLRASPFSFVACTLSSLEEMVETNNFHYSAAMSACEKSGDWQLASRRTGLMQPDLGGRKHVEGTS